MEYVTLSNGVKMPILGYGVYQVTKDECERCVLDALGEYHPKIRHSEKRNRRKIWKDNCSGHAPLAYRAWCGRDSKVYAL